MNELLGNFGILNFLGDFVAVGILCGQVLIYLRTELGSGM